MPLKRIHQDETPTVVSRNEASEYIIGSQAKDLGFDNVTNVFNFKKDIGAPATEFEKRKYWTLPPTNQIKGTSKAKLPDTQNIKTISAKEAAEIYLEKLLSHQEIPDKVIIGQPAISDKRWLERYRSNIRAIFRKLGQKAPEFFYEPFAVFNAYKHSFRAQESFSIDEDILIIDIGGSTFNSCIIRSNKDGELDRTSAYSVPLGIESEFCGGMTVDESLIQFTIGRARQRGINWKNDPTKDLHTLDPRAKLMAERVKIKLCEQLGREAVMRNDYRDIHETMTFPKGWLHPDLEIIQKINGNDLKRLIKKKWEQDWHRLVKKTIRLAQSKISKAKGKKNKRKLIIGKIILAGGSSKAPFLKDLICQAYGAHVDQEDILRVNNIGETVALGLALECAHQSDKNPELQTNKLSSCIVNQLYVGVQRERHSAIIPLTTVCDGVKRSDGLIFDAPLHIEDHDLTCEITLPNKINPQRFYYCFSDKPFEDLATGDFTLNHLNDVATLNVKGKLKNKAKLKISFKEDGYIKPELLVKGKGHRAAEGWLQHTLAEFELPNLNIREGNTFFGLDFGNTNSYIVEVHKRLDKIEELVEYPKFGIGNDIKRELRNMDATINAMRNTGSINPKRLIEFAHYQDSSLVYNSNKIEQIDLSYGETVALKELSNKLQPIEAEAKNLLKAYYWVLENYTQLFDAPERFLREVNRIIMQGVEKEAGQYRPPMKDFKIGGASFTPPASEYVGGLMKELSSEIKSHPRRSPIEVASSLHTKFVYIHPFREGNGRTARLLLNTILLNYEYPILIIDHNNRPQYIESLDSAVNGDISKFIHLILREYNIAINDYNDFITAEDEQENETVDFKARKELLIERNDSFFIRKSLETAILLAKASLNMHEMDRSYPDIAISIKEYGLPEEDFFTLEKKNKSVWFFSVNFRNEKHSESFLFYINTASPISIDGMNLDAFALHVARLEGDVYKSLGVSPVSIREIATDLTNLYSIPGIKQINRETFRQFFIEVIESYF
ncbi:hypothetical protein SYK_31210 [Pseudodesulfovibrio nedwellii]|uniref:Fido domain-containing protein n=1 Tax=Pseudodesulfovibrio nedwellii TaxID=2973072 RepID=A0ABM8B4S6_9BACT|nr:Fic family protein [Pseudodesulfovibrio nedwellii]BDQ38761.1 hypothetical protein SYK_31210 [Pseudodesulfovibrio nedwellii]